MKSTVSLLAIAAAACLVAACASTGAETAAAPGTAAPRRRRSPPPPPSRPPPRPTPSSPAPSASSREFSVIASRAQWVNATYITQDTDALAAHFGTIGTEMGVRFANEAARYANVPNLSYDTRRKLNMLRGGLTLPAPTTAGAAAELNRISTDLSSQYGRGRGTMGGAAR